MITLLPFYYSRFYTGIPDSKIAVHNKIHLKKKKKKKKKECWNFLVVRWVKNLPMSAQWLGSIPGPELPHAMGIPQKKKKGVKSNHIHILNCIF